eukprot:CAMPEP_0177655634 /NCGR_PEP_ID=MMETSP0447-20121125/15088_1 /TAXON_ID=0 /ORGANISM="Stygamoeba regulata, Strain BSH-02190019" /LENGTH=363 /DNA_ID=CAMNT_0019159599 /DNA_START=88 /DNA_END=1179 /DNA_ORIENTATION=-
MAGIGHANLFDLLKDSDEAEGTVTVKKGAKKPQQPAAAAAPKKPAAPKPAGKAAGKPAAAAAAASKDAPAKAAGKGKGKGDRPVRSAAAGPSGAAGPAGPGKRPNRPPRAEGAAAEFGGDASRPPRAQRAPRPPRDDKQELGPDGKPRGRRYDRHVSGTGRPPTENKKSGGGRSNWGKAGDEIEESAASEPKAEGEVEATEATEAEVPEKTAEEIAEEKQITLDQWKKQQQAGVSVDLRPKEQRVANTGLDSKLQKEMNKFKELKRDDDAPAAENNASKKAKPAKAKKGPVRVSDLLDIKFSAPEGSNPRRGGGSGGKRGGGAPPSKDARPRPQQQQPRDAASLSFDDSSFPSLGGKMAVAAN